jgi:hypothetical protein
MEDSQKTEDAIVMDELSKIAEQYGDIKVGTVVDSGETPMMVTSMENTDVVTIYDRKTGEPSQCLRYMLPRVLRKKKEDGTRAFQVEDPGFRPQRNTFKCLLHPDSPNREHYDELGLPTCPKDNIRNQYEVERHMQKRHKVEWATIERERERREKQEEREFQRNLFQGIRLKTEDIGTPEAPLYISDKPKKEVKNGNKRRKKKSD